MLLFQNSDTPSPLCIGISGDFNRQQCNILSLTKRFSDYETIGELFRGTMADAQEVAFAERIIDFFIEIAAELEDICG